jgi:hypothetical protein
MDSLGVLLVVQPFRAAVHTIGMFIFLEDINPRLIYSAPSVDKMTYAILGLVHKMEGIEHNQRVPALSREAKMKKLLEQYSRGLHSSIPAGNQPTYLQNVLLTGTTGSLGSYLLAAFRQHAQFQSRQNLLSQPIAKFER